MLETVVNVLMVSHSWAYGEHDNESLWMECYS